MAREAASVITPGDLVVRRGGSLTTLIRVTNVGAAQRVSMRMPRMEQVLSGIYMHRGDPHAVDDLPPGPLPTRHQGGGCGGSDSRHGPSGRAH